MLWELSGKWIGFALWFGFCGSGGRRASQCELAFIVDVGPTIAGLLGITLRDCDGAPIQRAS